MRCKSDSVVAVSRVFLLQVDISSAGRFVFLPNHAHAPKFIGRFCGLSELSHNCNGYTVRRQFAAASPSLRVPTSSSILRKHVRALDA